MLHAELADYVMYVSSWNFSLSTQDVLFKSIMNEYVLSLQAKFNYRYLTEKDNENNDGVYIVFLPKFEP